MEPRFIGRVAPSVLNVLTTLSQLSEVIFSEIVTAATVVLQTRCKAVGGFSPNLKALEPILLCRFDQPVLTKVTVTHRASLERANRPVSVTCVVLTPVIIGHTSLLFTVP